MLGKISYLALLVVLCIAVVTDIKSTKISNRLIVCGLTMGLIYRVRSMGAVGILLFFIYSSIPVILFYLLFQMRALGAGDIKLFSVIGSFLTIRQLVAVIAVAFIAGAFLGMCKLILKKITQTKSDGKFTKIHFSIPILISYIAVVMFQLDKFIIGL